MDKYKKILEEIPAILSSNEDLDICFDNILNLLNGVVSFESAYICYLNAGSADLRYRATTESADIFDSKTSFFEVTDEIKPLLYSTDTILFDSKHKIAKYFDIKLKKNFLLSKLLINDTVFGFIILVRDFPFSAGDAEISKIFCSFASYSIKDS